MKTEYDGLSPLLRHALESFEHGMEHFQEGSDSGRKFSLLHIDQAIELLIKEKLVRLGKSIYKGDGTTINIHEAFSSITRELAIPERPRLESLHDLRNNIQHGGLSIDTFTADYYVTEAYKFVSRFLADELGLKLQEYLSPNFQQSSTKAITVDPAISQGESIVDHSNGRDLIHVPFKGHEEYLDIPGVLLPKDKEGYYAFRIPNDEMKPDAFVYKDDVLILDQQSQIQDGEMWLFETPDGQKKLRYIYIEEKRIRLQPANPEMMPEFSLKDDLDFVGKVVIVIREQPK